MKKTGLGNLVAMHMLAAVLCLPALVAQASSGDLDPSFADLGRLAMTDTLGEVRFVESLQSDGIFVAGGGWGFNRAAFDWGVCAWGTTFFGRLDVGGSADATYRASSARYVQALAIARETGGKVVAVGRKTVRYGGYGRCYGSTQSTLAVFRLQGDGLIDEGFGSGGVFEWTAAGGHQAMSVSLEADGRIVVSGFHGGDAGDDLVYDIVVLRLLENGSLDPSFGDGGVYRHRVVGIPAETRHIRTAAGAYRVLVTGEYGCQIVGLTSNGELDASFGQAGSASVGSSVGNRVTCGSLEPLSNGELLVAGNAGERGFVARLLPNGAHDPSFVADEAIDDSMATATSVLPLDDGKVLVAGAGAQGAVILRLLAAGSLDVTFGDGGRTWIDLPSDAGSTPVIHDLASREDGKVIAAGGHGPRPFVARLLGDAGGASAGVLSFAGPDPTLVESEGTATLNVRRSGGDEGELSVRYRTVANGDAAAGEDFTPAEGILHWPSGDRSVQGIELNISPDAGLVEGPESFQVALEDLQGGAGIGKRNADVTIQADGFPAGQFAIYFGAGYYETDGLYQFDVVREFDFSGRVCVDVNPGSGTAIASEDFSSESSSVCWDDQEAGVKYVDVQLVDDAVQEGDETFIVELANPTGGAVIGPSGSIVATIHATDESPTPPPPTLGGGGPASPWELLIVLGLLLGARCRRFPEANCRAILRALVVAASFSMAPALAETGDLDPGFADHGRWTSNFGVGGAALFAESLSNGVIMTEGGDINASGSMLNLDGFKRKGPKPSGSSCRTQPAGRLSAAMERPE